MTPPSSAADGSPWRARGELFAISLLILFLELACIRWFPAHVLFLTFFTNTVLLACFLGMSVGCLAAGRARNYLVATPALLAGAVAAAIGVEKLMALTSGAAIDVGKQASPQMVFFGTEGHVTDVARFVIPLEVLAGAFFLLIALVMVGPGQVLGRALGKVPNRVLAYTVNILGSVAGIGLFALCSWCRLAPFWWFLPIALGLGYFLYQRSLNRDLVLRWGLLGAVLLGVGAHGLQQVADDGVVREHVWSPYYRIDYDGPPHRNIGVNLITHQQMVSRDDRTAPGHAYALPHLLRRDALRHAGQDPRPFEDVMVIGAGSGNDVSRALAWGAKHVDAVEIDPVIQSLGARDHPDRPYQDPRVTVHLDDGRNFLHATDKQYDLIVYALVDSLVLHSSYSNIRLESYLFTRQAFEDVKRRLKPGGTFVMYNYFRQGWIAARLQKGLGEVFGADPIVLTLPHQARIEPDQKWDGFTLFFSGAGTAPLREAFAARGEYRLDARRASDAEAPDGFAAALPAKDGECLSFAPAEVAQPADELRTASDDWPFLYLRRPMVPDLSVRGAAIMGGLALAMLFLFAPRGGKGASSWLLEGRMFFLGAGFMLVETKAVVQMALLFGSTWMVNSVVFFAVLVMILAANLFVLGSRPQRLWPYYAGLLLTLGLGILVPLDSFLGLGRGVQVAGASALVFLPILFAGVAFAVSFGRSAEPDRAFGANIAGAILGGLAEYASMLLGFQHLLLVAMVFYGLSAFLGDGLLRESLRRKTGAGREEIAVR